MMASCKSSVGVGEDRDPLVGVDGRTEVELRADVDLLDPDLRVEVGDVGRVLPREAPRRGLVVAAPLEDHVAVVDDVLAHVQLRPHHALEAVAPDVLGAPVPALPAVRLADLEGEAAHRVEQTGAVAVRRVDGLALAVAVRLEEDRVRPVLLVDPRDLLGDDVGRLVPRDAHVLALASVLLVALAVRVPVHALERVLDAVGRVGALLVAGHVRGGAGPRPRLERESVALHLPGPEGLGIVLPVEVERPDAQDLAVLDVDHDLAGAAEKAALRQGPDDGLVGGHIHFLPRIVTHLNRCPFAIGEVPLVGASVGRAR